MGLSEDVISLFIKNTKAEEKKPTNSTVYGTAVSYEGKTYVRLDGSDLLTPVTSTTTVKEGDRVTVSIGNHTATVNGNITDPSASSATVEKQGGRITDFEYISAYKVTAEQLQVVSASIENLKATAARIENADIVKAEIENLEAEFAEMEYVSATELEAITAKIESIEAKFGEFTELSTEDLEAINAEITNLKGYTAEFTYLNVHVLSAFEANITKLDVEKLDVNWANIDSANIDSAIIGRLFADYGIINELIINEGTVVKELIGVTIKGDLIEGNTIIADKLVVKGEDGIYYKLNVDALGEATASSDEKYQNGLDGTAIIANSITAEKLRVEDLVAFGATIAGFNLVDRDGDKPAAIYSGAKDSVDADSINGIYMDDDGQMNIGNESNYFKFYKNQNGSFMLALSAESVRFGTGKDFILDDLGMTVEGQSDDSNVPIKTNISNNGMRVYANGDEKLTANDKGVVATDLHAKTYLIVGDNSRFEDYDNGTGIKRTGCFWIGG